MNIKEVAQKLNLTVAAGGDGMDVPVTGCYIGDMMSLAMAQLEEGYIWITIQTNLNVVAVASLKEAGCVIREKLKTGEIAKSRYESYERMYGEIMAAQKY